MHGHLTPLGLRMFDSSASDGAHPELRTFPIVKFSFAQIPIPYLREPEWTHITGDLSLTLETAISHFSSRSQHSVIMKVLRKSDVLEALDLGYWAEKTGAVLESVRNLGVDLRDNQLPIAVITRVPYVAIRYITSEHKEHRRLQLKFSSDADFRIFSDITTSIGLRVSHNDANYRDPRSSQRASVGPRCPPSALDSISERPNTADSQGHMTVTPRDVSRYRPLRSYEHKGFNHEIIPPASDPVLQSVWPKSMFGYDGGTKRTTHTVETPNCSPRFETSSQVEEFANRPATASFPLYSVSSQSNAVLERQIGQSQASIGGHQTSEAVSSQDEQRLIWRPQSRQSSSSDALQSSAADTAGGPLEEPDATLEQTLSQIIPPRRALPFKKVSNSSSPASAITKRPKTSRASSSTRELPPLPRPTWAKEKQPKSSPSRGQIVSGVRISGGQDICRPQTSPGAYSGMQHGQDGPGMPISKRVSELRASTSALGEAAENSRSRTDGLQEAAASPAFRSSSPPPPSSPNPARGAPGQDSAPLDNILAHIASQPQADWGKLAGSLSRCANLSDAERRDAINDYFVKLLEDDSFRQLCEDASATWRLVGFDRQLLESSTPPPSMQNDRTTTVSRGSGQQ